MFLVYLEVLLGYFVSTARKLFDPKKISAIVNMPTPKMLKDVQVFNGMAQFYPCFIKKFIFVMAPIMKLWAKQKCLHGLPNVKMRGRP
jgi:hypothetical protein